MGEQTAISWTDHTFNPWWGCVKVSPACDHCYAATFSNRLGYDIWGKDTPRRWFGAEHWREPLKWNTAAEKAGVRRRVFCASMADVFEQGSSDLDEQRMNLWALIESTPMLDWLLLTKRPLNIVPMIPLKWRALPPVNVWYGTTVESPDYLWRVEALRRVPAAVRFISYEPALADVTWPLDGIHWLIAGGESGAWHREPESAWFQSSRDQCLAAASMRPGTDDAASAFYRARQLAKTELSVPLPVAAPLVHGAVIVTAPPRFYLDVDETVAAPVVPPAHRDEKVTTYTPMLWTVLTDEQKYEEYIRVREQLDGANAMKAIFELDSARGWAAYRELKAAPVVPPAQLQTHVDDVGDVVCEHGTAVDVHCCNCHSGFIFDDQHTCEPELPDGAIGDLLAYGREESASALARKDRDSYQFWQGWNSALERAASVATEAPQQQETKEEDDPATRGHKGVGCSAAGSTAASNEANVIVEHEAGCLGAVPGVHCVCGRGK